MPSRLARLRCAVAAAALLLPPISALAVGPASRISRIDTDQSAAIPKSVSPHLRSAADLGPADPARMLEGVTLHFSRTVAQQAAIDKLLADQQTPGSPRYHQWLTPAQFGQRFGLSAADIAKVTAWLQGQGLTITDVAPSNNSLTLRGTIAQLQHAFGTSLHTVSAKGELHVANVSDPVLPAGLAAVVSGITGLDDFRLRARVKPSPIAAQGVRPDFTSSLTGFHFLSPGDFRTIYNAGPLVASAINGTGATIAVVGQTDISTKDVAAFRAASGLPAAAIIGAGATIPSTGPYLAVVLGGTADPGVSTDGLEIEEAHLDTEWAGAIAPNAGVIYVNSTGVFNSLRYAISHGIGTIISISYGGCEAGFAEAALFAENSYLQQASVQGQTVVGPGGDSGATDCDYQSLQAVDGLAVDFPASSPNVTGVGGTIFNDSNANWSSGTTDQISSALGYIPENVWNESSTTTGLGATGGGASLFFPKPNWQVAAGVPSDVSRDVPDIALSAASGHVGYLICAPARTINQAAFPESCANGFRDTATNLTTVGGTSAGVPSFASTLALIQQKLGATTGLGNINPVLYGLAGTAAFHDIVSGNNSSPCIAGSPNCPTGGSIGFSAAPGYDQATGLGSIDASNLANAWASAVPAGGTSTTGSSIAVTTLTLPSSEQSCGLTTSALTLQVQVAGNSGQTTAVPSGTVQLLVDGALVGSPAILSAGTATLTLNTTGLSSGGHNVSALYSGDQTFFSSKGYLAVNLLSQNLVVIPASIIDVVSSTSPDFSLTPCLPVVNVTSGGSSAPITLTATAFNGFSGPVTLTLSADPNLTGSYLFSASPVTVSGAAAGTTTLTFSAFVTNAKSGTGLVRLPAGSSAHLSKRGVMETGAGTAALASVLLLMLPRRRRYTGLLAVVLAGGALGLSGCGSGNTVINGGGTTTPTKTNTATGTYLVNVTATGTGTTGQPLVHTATLTLNVQ